MYSSTDPGNVATSAATRSTSACVAEPPALTRLFASDSRVGALVAGAVDAELSAVIASASMLAVTSCSDEGSPGSGGGGGPGSELSPEMDALTPRSSHDSDVTQRACASALAFTRSPTKRNPASATTATSPTSSRYSTKCVPRASRASESAPHRRLCRLVVIGGSRFRPFDPSSVCMDPPWAGQHDGRLGQ